MAPTARPPTPDPDARCVLLVGGGAVPSNLVAALGQRGITVAIARSAPEVMTELAGGGVASVVVVEPDRQNRAGELHAASQRYHPGVRFWSYARQAPGREATLSVYAAGSGLTPDENAGSGANPWYPPTYGEQEAPPAATREPEADAGARPDAADRSPRTGPDRSAEHADDPSRVTEQELAMLLGSDSTPPPGTVPERAAGSVRGHGRESGRVSGRE